VANIYNRVRDAAEAGAIRSPVRYGLTRPTGNAGEFLPLEDWLQSFDAVGIAALSASVTTNTTAIATNTAAIATHEAAWTAYTPTIVPSTGSSTITTISGAYRRVGKTVHFRIAFTMSAAGTGATNLRASLPVPGLSANSVCPVLNGTSIVSGLIVSGSGVDQLWIYSATGAFPATGSFIAAGVYEAL
jgi:hypothetical protein